MSDQITTPAPVSETTAHGNFAPVASHEIDCSMKWPALHFLVWAVLWLLAGTVLGLIVSIKLTTPAFLASWEWLTYGRVSSAAINILVYGWSANAAFAIALWIMARLCQTRMRGTGLLLIAGLFWNIAVSVGIGGIIYGDMIAVEFLEMPAYVTPLMLLSYLAIIVWGIIAFRYRRCEQIYVSQFYILAALFWFPWLYTIAQIMIVFAPARGVVQSIANAWYGHNLLWLWLTPVGLAAAYYIIPKTLGHSIYRYKLAIPGFWALALFSSWGGMRQLTGGPVPAWVISASIAAGLLMIIPVLLISMNLHVTAFRYFDTVKQSSALRFIVFGAVAFTLAGLLGAVMGLRTIDEVTHFTYFTAGHIQLSYYAFFSMTMFGSIYFMAPRLLGIAWPSKRLINWHFWASAAGIVIVVSALFAGGLIQGLLMNALNESGAPVFEFLKVVGYTAPWLMIKLAGETLILTGHLAFAVNFSRMLAGLLMREIAREIPAWIEPEFGEVPEIS